MDRVRFMISFLSFWDGRLFRAVSKNEASDRWLLFEGRPFRGHSVLENWHRRIESAVGGTAQYLRRCRFDERGGTAGPSSQLQFSPAHEGFGAEFFAAAEKMDLEGIVSKKRTSSYRSGYTKAWLKVKTFIESEFIVIGYDMTPGGVRTLLVARMEDGGLTYAGRVMVTAGRTARNAIWDQLEKHRTDNPPLPNFGGGKRLEWFKPTVSVRVRHLRGEETLRHATLLGLS
jgi:bifunctional non-homologous end joining protein LigD